MRVLLALALIAVAGCAVEGAGGGAELRAVDAPADGIEAREGALLAALEYGEPARLLLVRPVTLRRVSRPLWLDEQFIVDHALSSDGRRLAIGSETHSRIELVDLRRGGWCAARTRASRRSRRRPAGGGSWPWLLPAAGRYWGPPR